MQAVIVALPWDQIREDACLKVLGVVFVCTCRCATHVAGSVAYGGGICKAAMCRDDGGIGISICIVGGAGGKIIRGHVIVDFVGAASMRCFPADAHFCVIAGQCQVDL